MKIEITVNDYLNYMDLVTKRINDNKDYITELDSKTGDGDHWINMNKGFQKVVASRSKLEDLGFNDLFKNIGILIMSTVGGASGALYGSAYIEGAKQFENEKILDIASLRQFIEAKLSGIMTRGKAKPGFKTMIDPLFKGLEYFEKALYENKSDEECLIALKEGSIRGMEDTKGMEAIKGRAYYQADKGIGHLDPGAVTMSYQIETLVDYLIDKYKKH